MEVVGTLEGKVQHLMEAFPCPTDPISHGCGSLWGLCHVQGKLGMWHIPFPPEALASYKDWGSLTCPKKRKGSRNVRPLHIQDWKPSAKDEVSVRTWKGLVDRGSLLQPWRTGGSVPTPCQAEEVLPLQPHCGHLQGGQWQGLLIQQSQGSGIQWSGPQLLPSVSGEVTAHSAWGVGGMFYV